MKPGGIFAMLKKSYADNRGITGLETAIILIAFIVVAAVFAFTVMTTGLFSTEKAKTTAQAGIAEATGALFLARILEFDHLGDPPVTLRDNAAVGERIVGPERTEPLEAVGLPAILGLAQFG